jgi:hypothetical protein
MQRRHERDVGHERAEHDPRSVAACDQHRVLSVEADAATRGGLAVDVLIRVDEHAIGPAETAPEHVEVLAQLCVGVRPCVAREPAFSHVERLLGQPVAERRRHDAPGAGEQQLGMARLLRARHRELHACEEAALPPFDDVALGLGVRLRAGDTEHVEAELVAQPFDIPCCHARIVHS